MSPSPGDRLARRLLVLGAGAGIALAAFGIVRSGSTRESLPSGAIAVVNGQPISAEAFARFAAAVAAERKSLELDDATRRRLLARMVDEELLLQRAADLLLYRHEPTARRAMVAALIQSVTADAEAVAPDEAALRRFYEENPERFTRPGRLSLEVAFVRIGDRPELLALREAQDVARRVRAGEEIGRGEERLGDPLVAELPAGPVPIETLRQYHGPTVARAAGDLEPGEVSEPIRGGDGYYVLRLRDRTPPERAPYDEVREQVRAEYLRSVGEEALRDYLAGLHDAAEIQVLDPELAAR